METPDIEKIVNGFAKMGAMVDLLFIFISFLVSQNIKPDIVDEILDDLKQRSVKAENPLPEVFKEVIREFENMVNKLRKL